MYIKVYGTFIILTNNDKNLGLLSFVYYFFFEKMIFFCFIHAIDVFVC